MWNQRIPERPFTNTDMVCKRGKTKWLQCPSFTQGDYIVTLTSLEMHGISHYFLYTLSLWATYTWNIRFKRVLFLTNAIKVGYIDHFCFIFCFLPLLGFVLFFTSPWVQFPTSLKSRLFITPRSTLNACLYPTMPTYEGIQKYLTLQHTRPCYLGRLATGKSCAGKINNSDKAIWYRMQFRLCASQERER